MSLQLCTCAAWAQKMAEFGHEEVEETLKERRIATNARPHVADVTLTDQVTVT